MRFLLILAVGLAACPSVRGDDDDSSDDDDATIEWDSSGLPEADSPVRDPLAGTINFVIDGDTFDVDLRDAGSDRVRVLAINTPEMNSDDPWGPDCWAEEAKDRAQALLPADTDVWLTFDGEVEDDFGRLLAYVWIGRAPQATFEDSFNWTMVREGHAWTFFFDNNRSFETELRQAEQQAAAEDLGVWDCN